MILELLAALMYTLMGGMIMYISAQENTTNAYESRRSRVLVEAARTQAESLQAREEQQTRMLHSVRDARTANAASTAVIASNSIADSARDQWMPMRLPTIPTVTPENARKPWLDME